MAHIRTCPYCSCQITDRPWHDRCRIAYLEGLLHKLRELTKIGAHADIQTVFGHLTEMTHILHLEQWCSSEKMAQELQEHQRQKLAEELRLSAHAEEMRKASLRWFNEHPLQDFLLQLDSFPEQELLPLVGRPPTQV